MESCSRWSWLPGFRALCVTTLTWNPVVRACAVGGIYCGHVEGGNPAVGVPPHFSSVRVSLAAPCNYSPGDKMDSGQGLVFVAAALVAQLFLCLPYPPKVRLVLRLLSPGGWLQMVRFWKQLSCTLTGKVWIEVRKRVVFRCQNGHFKVSNHTWRIASMCIVKASPVTNMWILSVFYMTSLKEIATSNAEIHCDKARQL